MPILVAVVVQRIELVANVQLLDVSDEVVLPHLRKEKSESPQAAELGDTKPSISTKVWTSAGAYLSIGVGNFAELLNMLLGQLDAVGVAHQDVLFDRDRSIPRCVRFLKQLTQC